MSKYFISVIMPIYNAEKYVKKSIDSLVNQTTNEIEIILVDDGSTDGSGSICDQYDGSENIKIIHKENGGICTARNAGLLQAEGQYVSFIDSDDFMDLVAYEKIIKVLKNNQADILDFGWRYVSETGEKTENFHENPKKLLLDKSYIKKQVLPPLLNLKKNRKNFVFDFSWNKIYRKEIIDKYQIHFDEKRNTWEDRIFIVEFLNDFSAQYATDYWCRSIENMIIQQLRVKDQHPEVIQNIKKILKELQVKTWYKNRTKKDQIDYEISQCLKENEYDRVVEIYENKLEVFQKQERKASRNQMLRRIVRKLKIRKN